MASRVLDDALVAPDDLACLRIAEPMRQPGRIFDVAEQNRAERRVRRRVLMPVVLHFVGLRWMRAEEVEDEADCCLGVAEIRRQ